DFGLAKFVGEASSDGEVANSALTQAGAGLGTPGFMPPEQFDAARTVDERADVYALGTMLFVALTGEMPFDGNLTQILTKQMLVTEGEQPMPSARSLDPKVPAPLDELCRSAMALDREQRLASADAFVVLLDGHLGGRKPAPLAPAVPPTAPAPRQPRPAPPSPRAGAAEPASSHATSSSRVALFVALPLFVLLLLGGVLVAKSSKPPEPQASVAPSPEPPASVAPSPAASPVASAAPSPAAPSSASGASPEALPEGLRKGEPRDLGHLKAVPVYLWRLPNGADVELVWVAPGSFLMG